MYRGAISDTQMWVTIDICLIGLKTHSTGVKSLMVLETSQPSLDSKVMDLSKESATTTFLNKNNSLLSKSCL